MIRAFVLAVALSLFAVAAQAQSGVRVNPILLTIEPGRRATALRLHNANADSRAFEIIARRWTQEDGAEALADTNELLVTPSVFEIAPGRTQIVRMAPRAPADDAPAERAYRLFVREIALESGAPTQGLRLQLELSLPLFVRGAPARTGALSVSRHGEAVEIANTGPNFLRLAAVEIDGAPIAAPRYLLAGARFTLPAPRGVVRARFAPDGERFIEAVFPDAQADRSDR